MGPSENLLEHTLFIILAVWDSAHGVSFDKLTMVALYIFAFQSYTGLHCLNLTKGFLVVFFFFIDGGEKLSISYPTPFIQSLLCVILSPALKSHICVTSLHVNHNRVIFMSRDQVQKMCVCVCLPNGFCVSCFC